MLIEKRIFRIIMLFLGFLPVNNLGITRVTLWKLVCITSLVDDVLFLSINI